MDAVERAEAELYLLAPEDFVAERDAHVARAKESGDRDAARAIAALRRPSRAAWLTNLLVHDRPDEVEGLLGLADTLAAAQRSLDGSALRTISAQRSKLVGALSRQAAALGREAGHRVESTLEREVRTVLESALADPELAGRIRSGRLVKAERHAGFGPSPDEGVEPKPSRPGTGGAGSGTGAGRDGRARRSGSAGASGRDGTDVGDAGAGGSDRERSGRGDSGRGDSGRGDSGRGDSGRGDSGRGDSGGGDSGGGQEPDGPGRGARTDAGAEPDPDALRRERALTRARAEADRARDAAEKARERHATARAEAEDAERRRDGARDRVTELIEALERARTEAGAANRAAHTTATAEKEAARAARTAETTRDRADAAVRELQDG